MMPSNLEQDSKDWHFKLMDEKIEVNRGGHQVFQSLFCKTGRQNCNFAQFWHQFAVHDGSAVLPHRLNTKRTYFIRHYPGEINQVFCTREEGRF